MKVSLALKNLVSEKIKFTVSVLGVALSILIILTPFGVYFGSIYPSRALPEKSGADLWVIEQGSGDLFHTRSLIPDNYSGELKQVDGVQNVSHLINNPSRIKINDTNVTAAIIGFDTETDLGAPWKIYEGTKEIKPGELIMDRSLAYLYGVSIGDTITISGKEFSVVGISAETNVLVFQYIFIPLEDAIALFNQNNLVNYYLVEVDDRPVSEVKRGLTDLIPRIDIKTSEEIADSNAKVIEDSFLPIISILAFVGLFVGVAVIGLTIYSLTTSKEREYGVLKAIGISDVKLYSIVFQQSLITSVLGYLAGSGIYFFIVFVTYRFFPQVNFALPNNIFGYIFLLSVIMSLLASFIPIHKINSLDPADVFKR